MKDTIVEHKEKVPFLGDIPILRKLFSASGKSKEKTELVIFLTPHIIEGDKTTKDAKKYIDEWKEKKEEAEIERPKEPKFEWPRLKRKETGKVQPKRKKWAALLQDKTRVPSADSVPVNKKTAYEKYYLMVRQEIDRIARRQDVSGLKGEVELKFSLDRDGFLTRSPIVLNKPDLKLVRAAMNCVKKAVPFSPFPKEMKEEEREFYIVVRYK